jgi:hypothetical protein
MGYTVFGSGGGGTVDLVARGGVDAIAANPNELIPPNGSIFAAGFLWTNKTASPIAVPAVISEANMLGALFTQGLQGASATAKIRYTANGIISDTDHHAILDGVTAMVITATTAERRITLYNAGTAPVSIVDTSGAQFIVTNHANPIFTQASTDSTIVINQSHRDGTLVFDGVSWEFIK